MLDMYAVDEDGELSEFPKVNPNDAWKVNYHERLSAKDNRPGLKKLYLRIVDDKGDGLSGIKVRFDCEHGRGMAFDHANVWGRTGDQGFIEWDHYGVPTHYMIWMEDDETPLIENIRTDLRNEYHRESWWDSKFGNRPVNKPGVFSYRFQIQAKVDGD